MREFLKNYEEPVWYFLLKLWVFPLEFPDRGVSINDNDIRVQEQTTENLYAVRLSSSLNH